MVCSTNEILFAQKEKKGEKNEYMRAQPVPILAQKPKEPSKHPDDTCLPNC